MIWVYAILKSMKMMPIKATYELRIPDTQDKSGRVKHALVQTQKHAFEQLEWLTSHIDSEWELIKRPHGAVAGRSLQEIQHGIRWGGQRNKWFASSGTDTVHRVAVPGCWEASGIGEPGKGVPHLCYDSIEQELRHFYAGACWYRKDVPIPAEWKGSRLWLKVGGIRSRGWCYVNGHAVALFDSGVGAWKWEITDFAKPGETALVMVCAANAVAARVNAERKRKAPGRKFSGSAASASARSQNVRKRSP